VIAGVGTNRYAYAENDPVNKSDANGHADAGETEVDAKTGKDIEPTDTTTLSSALSDTAKAVWNGVLGSYEFSANLLNGTIPGQPDYIAFTEPYHAAYDTPTFGNLMEIAVPGLAATKAATAAGKTSIRADNILGLIDDASKKGTLQPGKFAVESIPGHLGKPTRFEQQKVNQLMEKYGCHTCGTKNPGTKNGNAVVDHQPPQALQTTTDFYPQCIGCSRRQGGEVLQELRARQQ
jgi:hypothetical protein